MLLRLWETLLCIDDTASLCACLCVCVFERVYTRVSQTTKLQAHRPGGSDSWGSGVRRCQLTGDGDRKATLTLLYWSILSIKICIPER